MNLFCMQIVLGIFFIVEGWVNKLHIWIKGYPHCHPICKKVLQDLCCFHINLSNTDLYVYFKEFLKCLLLREMCNFKIFRNESVTKGKFNILIFPNHRTTPILVYNCNSSSSFQVVLWFLPSAYTPRWLNASRDL